MGRKDEKDGQKGQPVAPAFYSMFCGEGKQMRRRLQFGFSIKRLCFLFWSKEEVFRINNVIFTRVIFGN